MIYFLILFYTFILVYKYDIKRSIRGFKVNYYVLLALVCCISGFSYRLGMDTVGYMIFYKSVDPDVSYVIRHPFDYRYEPLFMIFLSLCKSITDDFTIVQFIIAIFVNSTIFWFLRKHSPYFYVALLFFFVSQYWNINFEIKRESITISLFLIAIDGLLGKNVGKKEYIRYYAICIFMLFCHRFAFITLFYPLFTKVRFNKITLGVFTLLIIGSILNIKYVSNLIAHINLLSSFVDVQDAVTYYTQSDTYGSGNVSLIGIFTSTIIPLFMAYKVRGIVDNRIQGLAICYLLIHILTFQVFIFYRLSNYLCFFIYIIYSNYAKYALSRKYNKAAYSSVLILAFAILLIGKFNKDQYIRYYPYNSIFTKEYNKERESEYYKLGNGMNVDF